MWVVMSSGCLRDSFGMNKAIMVRLLELDKTFFLVSMIYYYKG